MTATARERPGFVASRLGNLKAALRRRGAAWARRRQGDDRLPVTIATRRVYILPTRAGLGMALLLFVMLIAGLNYANSIALMVTFLLGGFVLIAMHLTHRNLVGVLARGIAAVDAFAGEHGLVLLTLESSGKVRRFAIDCEVAGSDRVAVTLPEEGTARADLAVPLERRGRLLLKRVKISTAFPYGLFRAWTYLHLELPLLAWPVPRGRREPPPEASTGGEAVAVHRAGDEEWAGLREFRNGDSPRQVAWGVYARGGGLMVKTYQSPAAHHRMFDLASLSGGIEERLEQLSAWVMAAHARGERFGLKLGDVELAPDAGNEHRRRCLDALARHGDAEIAEGSFL
jgi:uncharacterized protein (DUF58 family)